MSIWSRFRSGPRRRPRRRQATSAIPGVRRRLAAESLEQRQMLDNDGLLPANSAHLTLSFVPDGTDVAGQSSALYSHLNQIAADHVWQETVLRAFQKWSSHTNADVGLVSDTGDPMGVAGPRALDARFGDIRVAAVPLSPDVMAISIPNDAIVAGSWVADVLVNSAANFQSLDELYTVMVHEAGHVFGLEHSDDPMSPMHMHGPAAETVLTQADIANLHALFGQRVPDVNEGDDANDDRDNATELDTVNYEGTAHGSAPAVAMGDIGRGDRDFFDVETVAHYVGPVTFTLRTRGLSALDGLLRIYDGDGTLIGQTATANPALGQDVSVTINKPFDVTQYFTEVVGRDTGDAAVGGYALIVTHDDMLLSTTSEIDQITSSRYRFLSPDDLEDFFEENEDPLLDDDQGADDDFAFARELPTLPGFAEDSRYEVSATLTTATDVDYYALTSARDADVMLINVRTWADPTGLIPQLAVFDESQRPVPFDTLLNGSGELSIQVKGIRPHSKYLVRVGSAAPGTAYAVGNYRLSVRFATQSIELPLLVAGTLTASQPQATHTFYVAQPQIFHFLLGANGTGTGPNDAVHFTISDTSLGVTVASGDARSLSGTLLGAGEYRIHFAWGRPDGAPAPGSSFAYRLFGSTVSTPFGVVPIEPLNEPTYACSAVDPRFCFPNGVVLDRPYLIDPDAIPLVDGPILLDPDAVLDGWWNQPQLVDPPVVDPPAPSKPGDANRDGVFDSADLIVVFRAGQFEDNIIGNSTWETGDWDGDRDFTTSDLIAAFQAGEYRP